MFEHRFRETWIALLLALATVAPASAEGPRAGFKLNAEATFTSPDQTIRVEQYFRDRDDRLLYQFWTFDADHRHPFLLNPGEGDDVAGYAAGFRFSPDRQWLVRMQKLGSGSQTLFLYRRKGYQFSPATKKSLGDLAWDYFFTTPTSKGMHRDPQEPVWARSCLCRTDQGDGRKLRLDGAALARQPLRRDQPVVRHAG
jgi:hypothetical protein